MRNPAQRGMALLASLVFLLLLTLIGLSSLQNATLQEKMTGNLMARNLSFQIAESALRTGESAVRVEGAGVPLCVATQCLPPAESALVTEPGFNAASGVMWVAAAQGLYGLQNLGSVLGAVNVPAETQANLFRVTAVGIAGQSRSVVESVYALY